MPDSEADVVIIGAGSTGLLLAQGLKTAGISFRIFERQAADYVSREWSMSLHWGGEFLAELLSPDLHKRLNEINVDPSYDFSSEKGYTLCNGETGDVLLVMPGTMPKRISRRKLKSFLSEGIDIEYGKSFESFQVSENGVTVYLTDSSHVKARVLIGADGSRSHVRQFMIKDNQLSDQKEVPCTLVNFPYTYPAEVAKEIREIHPIMKIAYHPKLNMMYLSSILSPPDANGNVTFQNLMTWKGPPYRSDLQDSAVLRARFKELGSQFAGPYRAAALGVPDDFTGLFVDQGYQWDPRFVFKLDGDRSLWNGHHYGCVTLAGDAAHSMLPHRGQALNHAFEDASRLLAALRSSLLASKQSVAAAIGEYESEMVARAGLEVEVTSKSAEASHNWELLMQSPIFKHGTYKSQK